MENLIAARPSSQGSDYFPNDKITKPRFQGTSKMWDTKRISESLNKDSRLPLKSPKRSRLQINNEQFASIVNLTNHNGC